MLRALITQWRREWSDPRLPFIIFQITPNRKPQTDPNEKSGIAVLQEAQPNTFLTTPATEYGCDASAAASAPRAEAREVKQRGRLPNLFARPERGEAVKIAYFGGNIASESKPLGWAAHSNR